MDSPDYTPSENLTHVKGTHSPDCTLSESTTPKNHTAPPEHHYPTPPDSKPKLQGAPGSLQINTHIATSEETWGKDSQRTITKSEDFMSVQERRVLKAYAIFIDAYNSLQPKAVDFVQVWTQHVESVPEPRLIVAMNPFYDEYVDGDYYTWLNDTYYEGHMPEIVRRANAFRGFPQLDEEVSNPQGWEQKHAYYQSLEGIRDMEPYQAFIESEKVLLDPPLCEYDRLAEEEASREDLEAFQKTWANTLGLADEPTSATLRASSTPTSATPKMLSSDSKVFSAKTPALPAVKTEPTSAGLAARPNVTTAKAEGLPVLRVKPASLAVERAAQHASCSPSNVDKKRGGRRRRRRRRHHCKDSTYEPGSDDNTDQSDNNMPRKRNKKSRM